jgi:hypothetical protein
MEQGSVEGYRATPTLEYLMSHYFHQGVNAQIIATALENGAITHAVAMYHFSESAPHPPVRATLKEYEATIQELVSLGTPRAIDKVCSLAWKGGDLASLATVLLTRAGLLTRNVLDKLVAFMLTVEAYQVVYDWSPVVAHYLLYRINDGAHLDGCDLVDWAIAHYSAEEYPYLFWRLFDRTPNVDAKIRLLNHAPRLMQSYADWSLTSKSQAEIDQIILHGYGRKLSPNCLLPLQLTAASYWIEVDLKSYLVLVSHNLDGLLKLAIASGYEIAPERLTKIDPTPELQQYLDGQSASYRARYNALMML